MRQATDYGKEFPPNRSKRNLSMLYIIVGICMAGGLIASVAGLANSRLKELEFHDAVGAGGILFGCGLLFFFIGHFLTTPFNVHYLTGKEGITLQAFRTTLVIPYADIEAIHHLEERKGEALLLKLQNQTAQKQLEMVTRGSPGEMLAGLKNAFMEQGRAHGIYKFLSVPLAFRSSGRRYGPDRTTGADLPCDTVFILLKSGDGYLISPLDIQGFLREAGKYMPPQPLQ